MKLGDSVQFVTAVVYWVHIT